MVDVRIEARPAFDVLGRRTWISGQDNAQFAAFWARSHSDGLIDRLKALSGGAAGPQTGADVFGVSCVDADPADRAFFFWIAAEAPDPGDHGLERRPIPACRWAIFAAREQDAGLPALIEAEMFAFTRWLPASGLRHARAPELEVYPASAPVEFWLPVEQG